MEKESTNGGFFMRRRTDIETEDLGNGITRINEYDFVNCYLIEGETGAALIDAGAGMADVGAVVKTITDKPVTVLVTHAHADHIGGAVWFPEVWLHPADLRRGKAYMKPTWRAYFLWCHRYKKKTHKVPYIAAFQKDYSPVIRELADGQAFDLGGRTVETVLTPGHSPGSVIFRDSLTGATFTGDNVNLMVTLQFPGGTTVREWIGGAEKTLETAGDAPIWGGHGDGRIPRTAVERAIALANEAVAEGNEKNSKVKTKRGENRYPMVVYRADKAL